MIDPRAMLLAGGCVLFGALILGELYGGIGTDSGKPGATRAAPIEEPRVVPLTRPARLDDLLATSLTRPLFSPTRRPPETGNDGPNAGGIADKRLTGIVITPDRQLAIFAVNGAKPLMLSEGESVDGWRVETIAPQEVSLISPNGTQTLRPKPDPNAVRQVRFHPPGNAAARPPAVPARSFPPPGPAAEVLQRQRAAINRRAVLPPAIAGARRR